MTDFNKEPIDMVQIKELDFGQCLMHYVLGKTEFRQPFINRTSMNGTYKLQMFPLGYEGFEELGFAFRIKDGMSLVYYRYGNESLWNELEKEYKIT